MASRHGQYDWKRPADPFIIKLDRSGYESTTRRSSSGDLWNYKKYTVYTGEIREANM